MDHRQLRLHPTTLAWDNTLISPDYPGATREVIEDATRVPCVFLLGACGDLGPRNGFVGDTAVADRNGRQLGYAAPRSAKASPRLAPATSTPERSNRARPSAPGDRSPQRRRPPIRSIWRARSGRSTSPTESISRRPTRRVASALSGSASTRTPRRGDSDQAAVCRTFIERMDRQLSRSVDLPEGRCFPFDVRLLQAGERALAGRWWGALPLFSG